MVNLSFKTQSPLNATLTARGIHFPLERVTERILQASRRWFSTMGIWGASAGAGALLLLSVTPLVRREALSKVPILGSYYEDKTPASDKPF